MNREQSLITKDVAKDTPHSIDHNSNHFHVGQRLTLTLLKKLNLFFYSFSVAKEQNSILLSFRFCPRDSSTASRELWEMAGTGRGL